MNLRRISLLGMLLVAVAAIVLVANVSGGAHSANAQDTSAKLTLDMDTTNGSGPCNPVDDTYTVNAGDTFTVAICLKDSSYAPFAFNIDVLYNDTLNKCVPVDCPGNVGCVDGNPDANAGSSSWTSPDLGADCDCSIGGEAVPTCDKNPGDTGPGKGDAFIDCYCGTPTLPYGDGVSSAIAMLTLKNVAEGSDTFTFTTSALYEVQGGNILKCPGDQCPGGTLEVSSVPATETPVGEATATLVPGTTPAEETPQAQAPTENPGPAATAFVATAMAQGTPIGAINQAVTATAAAAATKAAATAAAAKTSKTATAQATKSGTANKESGGGSSGPNAALIAGIAIVAVIVAGAGGWFGYRHFIAKT